MGVKSPADISATFAKLFNARDKTALVSLYEQNAMLTIDGAEVARGHAAIAAMMAPMFESPLKLAARAAPATRAATPPSCARIGR